MISCSQCGRALDPHPAAGGVPSISGEIMGDEYTESYHRCTHCGAYTMVVNHDRFLGEETDTLRGPIPQAEAEAKIALIRQCPAPGDKRCRCDAHRSYFGPWLG